MKELSDGWQEVLLPSPMQLTPRLTPRPIFIGPALHDGLMRGPGTARIRRKGSRVIAVIMALAVILILWELTSHHGHFSYNGMIVAGSIAFFITLLRLHLLWEAQVRAPTPTRKDLIGHAKADLLHSSSVVFAGLVFKVANEWPATGQWLEEKLAITPSGADKVLACVVISYILYQAQGI